MADVPVQIGRYAVVRELGSGGMGEVLLAYSPAGSPVAVKVIRSDRLDASTRARFEKEALIARTVIGTNRVARFLDADPYADRPWLAMEYVPGQTLLRYVDDYGVLPVPLVASLGALAAEGLDAVHAAGLLHRDLKPQNIILGGDGPMIIDFGLGAFLDASQETLSHTGTIIGTVRCMPPEQANGNPHLTTAADVYALGAVLLYAAAGHYPYDGSRWEGIVAQVANPGVQPNLSGTPDGLVPLLESMLAHEPHDRPTLASVADACTALLAGAAVTPAAARLALIARTAGSDTPRVGDQLLSPSLEARLAAVGLSDGGPAQVSPLDAAPAPEPVEIDEGGVAQPDRSSMGPARRRTDRRPVSQRVAEDLRTEYAVRPAL